MCTSHFTEHNIVTEIYQFLIILPEHSQELAPDSSRITGSKNDFSVLIEPHQHPFSFVYIFSGAVQKAFQTAYQKRGHTYKEKIQIKNMP